MRDTLPVEVQRNECGVMNLDSAYGTGTHWVCYRKRGNAVTYFDSFGNLPPPVELTRYLTADGSHVKLRYNYEQQQAFDSVICGHLCLRFLCTAVS